MERPMSARSIVRSVVILVGIGFALTLASGGQGEAPDKAGPPPKPALVPLLWTQGQPPETIRTVIREIAEGGNTGFVWESRPHPDYLGPRWWADLRVAVDEARRRGLEVWIFDEWMYPSGIAGGRVVAQDPSFTRHILADHALTVSGPVPERDWGLPAPLEPLEEVVSVSAFPVEPRGDDGTIDLAGKAAVQDLTRVRWAVPSGGWRICWTTARPEAPREGWRMDTMVDVLNPKVSETFLRLTHEETYKRFAADFGRTIKGFFSDETGFRNIDSYDSLPGKPGMPMPWSPVFLGYFEKAKGYDPRPWLASLWYDLGRRGRAVRFDLMDTFASALAESYFKPQQDWCRAHGVRLIGHLVEDNGADHNLGYGPGHWFRAMRYFDMPGIDVVGYQVTPGLDAGTNVWEADSKEGWDQEFFQFGLPAMARGAALIQGTTEVFSEAFGAYGWGEGLRMTKWIGDWHLVNGIGVLSPHAMTMKFNDPDCPPHFNRTSGNPQWRYYSAWSAYAKRLQKIVLESEPVYDAAVLYTAESSWAGPARAAAPVVRALETRQVSTVVLPYAAWAGDGEFAEGRWRYHGQSFPVVVLPSVKYAPARAVERLADFAEQGGRVIVIDRWPEGSVDGREDEAVARAVDRLKSAAGASLVALPDIGAVLEGSSRTLFSPGNASLVLSRRRAAEGDWIFLHNRSLDAAATGVLAVTSDRPGAAMDRLVRYDAERDGYLAVPTVLQRHGFEATLSLPPGALWTLRIGPPLPAVETPAETEAATEIRPPWEIVEIDDAGPETGRALRASKLGDWRRWPNWSRFAGTLRYRASLEWDATAGPVELDAGDVRELAELRVNGRTAGVRLAPPYVWDVTSLVRPGRNTIELDVTNTAQARWSDPFSRGDAVSGLLGPVRILTGSR
jgi:hypothetical protein